MPTLTYLGIVRTPRHVYFCLEKPGGAAVILEQLWPTMSISQKEEVRKQLVDILRIMRQIEPEAVEIAAGKDGHPPSVAFVGAHAKQ